MKIDFASGLERWAFSILDKAKVKVRYEPESFKYHRRTQRTYCRKCNSKDTYKIASYTPDFRIGRSIYIETKGHFKPSNRTAMEDFLQHYPDFDLRFVFGADNFLTKKRLNKYSDWANALGVKYAIHEIPEEWLEEARQQLASGRKSL